MSVLTVLKSKGMESVVEAIRNKLPATAGDYTAGENIAIESAIEECWKRVERLYEEQKGCTV